MDNQYLDHANIVALKQLFRSFSREALTTMKQLKLCEQDIPRFPPLNTLSVFISVELLDMHCCGLTDFPGALIARAMPVLVTVDLSNNRLPDVTGVLPLGTLKHLRDLRLEGNPMPFIALRSVLLQKLLYPEKLVLLTMKRIYSGMHRQVALPSLCRRKPLSLSQLLSLKPKPAPVPRQGTFPVLEFICGGRITEGELENARPYPEEDIFSSPQHPRPRPPPTRQCLHAQPKSCHPCFLRKPRIEPTPRWVKVEPVLLSGTARPQRPREAKTDHSLQHSFAAEEDSEQESLRESVEDAGERLPPLKGRSALGGTY